MYGIHPQIVFGFIASATAAVAVWTWPRVGLAFGVAFTGLALLNLYTLLRLWTLERELTGGSGLSLHRAGRPSGRSSRDDPAPPDPRRAAGRTGVEYGRERPTPTSRKRKRPHASQDVEALLRERVGAGGPPVDDEISFLPAGGEEAHSAARRPARAGPQADRSPGAGGGGDPDRDDPDRAAETGPRNVPIPRHFALGTVAIIRNALTPDEVARVLTEQRQRPRQRFGQVAVSLGYLTEDQLQELLVAQQKGLFSDDEIREARRRLRAYRELEAGHGRTGPEAAPDPREPSPSSGGSAQPA